MVSAYLAPTHPQPCGGGQGGGSGGDRGDRGDRGGGDRGGGLLLTELQIGYDSTRRVHLAAGQALFNVPRRTAARLPLALATPTAACSAGGASGGAAGGGAVAVASALELLGPAGREMMRDLAGAAELPSGKGVDSGWGERRP